MRRIVVFFDMGRLKLSWFSTIPPAGNPSWFAWGSPLFGPGPKALAGLVLLLGFGCASPPYQPALLYLPGREPGKALRDAVEPVHTFFPRVRFPRKNLILTGWIPLPGLPYPCRARAEILARPVSGGTLLEIAVQRSKLQTALLTQPAWVDDGGDRSLEERLRKVLAAQLGGRPVKPGEVPRRQPASRGSG